MTAVKIPARGVRTPAFDLMAVREKEPVAGYAPRNGLYFNKISSISMGYMGSRKGSPEDICESYSDQFLGRVDDVIIDAAERFGNSNVLQDQDNDGER